MRFPIKLGMTTSFLWFIHTILIFIKQITNVFSNQVGNDEATGCIQQHLFKKNFPHLFSYFIKRCILVAAIVNTLKQAAARF